MNERRVLGSEPDLQVRQLKAWGGEGAKNTKKHTYYCPLSQGGFFAALDRLPPGRPPRTTLSVFAPPSNAPQAAQRSSSLLSPGLADLADAELWRMPNDTSCAAGVSDRAYNAWVTRLASAMLTHCSCPLLRLLHGVAGLQPALAELLLPEAFRDILQVRPAASCIAEAYGCVAYLVGHTLHTLL